MARLKVAVIGLGRIASTIDDEIEKYDGNHLPYSHIACYRDVPNVEIVGMADTWEEQRESARQRWSFDALYADYRQMLEETRPDIVSVCTSAKPRGAILTAIANGGYGVKAIWADKPITLSLAEADEAIAACAKAGIVLAVNCTRRWRADYRQALELLNDGAIGDLLFVQSRAQCGLSHNGSHLITTQTMFMPGRATSLVGEADIDEAHPDNDFAGSAVISYPGHVRGYVRAFANGPAENSHDIVGTNGAIRILHDGREIELWTQEPGADNFASQKGLGAFGRRFFPPPRRRRSGGVNAIYNLLDCMETGDAPHCSGEDAREALEIAIAIRESERRRNRPVELPLQDRSLKIISTEVVRSELPRAILRQREGMSAADWKRWQSQRA